MWLFPWNSFQSLLHCHKKIILKSKHVPKTLTVFHWRLLKNQCPIIYSLCPLCTVVLSAICQMFLVLLWAHPHSLKVRNGCVIGFGSWNVSGNVMRLFKVKASRTTCAPRCWLCPAGCLVCVRGCPSTGQGVRTPKHRAQPACLHKLQEWDLKRCSLLPHLPVYLDFSSCSNYRFIRNCKNSTERSLVSLVPFTQFSLRFLSYIIIKCCFKSLRFGGYLSISYSNREVFLFKCAYLNCRDMKFFQTHHILISSL